MLRPILCATLLLSATAAHAGPMQNACLARGTWDSATCTCMQGVADKHLTPDQQELGEAYFARRITSQQIAAERGVAVAQDFLANLSSFMNESTSTCGAP